MQLPSFLRNKIVWAIGALLVVVLVWRLSSSGDAAPKFATEAVGRGEVVARVSASGTLSALVTVDVGSQVSGRIQALFVDFNSIVKKGDHVAKIDPAIYEAAAAQARANVIAARGNLQRLQVQAEEAKRLARRSEQLFGQRIVAENDRDTTRANARAAEAAAVQAEGQLQQANAALRQAETNLRYTDIIAPTDGIVISRAVNVGQTVAATMQAPIIFTIAQDLRAMQVHTSVAESDIGRLKVGMEATFTVDAYPSERFRGRINMIRNAAQVVQNVVTYDAVIEVANPELKLKPGMTATVSVIADRRADVLRVPNAALRFRPDFGAASGAATSAAATSAAADEPGTRSVYVLVKGKPEHRSVRIGLADTRYTEIIGGELKVGEPVIMGAETAGSATRSGGRGGPPRML